ncbi:laccase-5-like, partial [Sitophilus oryzae]|uniref:Laccase-5-like n=1 Tax=Sitophilus oryzae TaxID=7048 RepID=A0A6J2X617_SITOR
MDNLLSLMFNIQSLKLFVKQINSLNKGTESNNTKHVSMPELSSLDSWDSRLKVDPDVQIYLAYDFYTIDNKYFHREGYEFNNVTSSLNQLLTPQINHISMEIPSFSLLSQRDEIPKNMFCNNDTIKDQDCANSHCECPHGYQIPLNAVVELVIIDEGFAYDANHPLHLHGYAFRVVAMERLGRNVTVDEVKKRDSDGYIKRNLINAPIKDTVNVPDGGYTIVRFKADNPGYWIFHCHIEFHAEVGMALVFQVGENGQMPPVPKGFPTCGNYLPEVSCNPRSYILTWINQHHKFSIKNYVSNITTCHFQTFFIVLMERSIGLSFSRTLLCACVLKVASISKI